MRVLSLRSRAILLFCGLLTTAAFAHPHVFVDAKVMALFDEKGFAGVLNRWTYDEIYSAAKIATADRNRDGKLSDEESEILKPAILAELERSNYYNYILSGSEFLEAKPVKNINILVENNRLVLDFKVPFSVPVGADYSMLVIVVADPSNYIKVTSDMENADVSAPGSIDVEYFSDTLEGLSLFRAFLPDVEGLYLRFKKK